MAEGTLSKAADPPQNTLLTQTPSFPGAHEDRLQPATSSDYGKTFSPWILSLTATSQP